MSEDRFLQIPHESCVFPNNPRPLNTPQAGSGSLHTASDLCMKIDEPAFLTFISHQELIGLQRNTQMRNMNNLTHANSFSFLFLYISNHLSPQTAHTHEQTTRTQVADSHRAAALLLLTPQPCCQLHPP